MLSTFTSENYFRTFSSLQSLQDLLRCQKCEKLTKDLYTLGGCEHMFCGVCCEDLMGNECVVCWIPTHVKDAKVNRQMSNMVELCQELDRILRPNKTSVHAEQTSGGRLQDELESTPPAEYHTVSTCDELPQSSFTNIGNSVNLAEVVPAGRQNTRRSKGRNWNVDENFEKVLSSRESPQNKTSTLKNKCIGTSRNKVSRNNSSKSKPTTLCRLQDKALVQYSPQNKILRGNTQQNIFAARRIEKPSVIEQTTMTQFFQFDDEDAIIDNEDAIVDDEDATIDDENAILNDEDIIIDGEDVILDGENAIIDAHNGDLIVKCTNEHSSKTSGSKTVVVNSDKMNIKRRSRKSDVQHPSSKRKPNHGSNRQSQLSSTGRPKSTIKTPKPANQKAVCTPKSSSTCSSTPLGTSWQCIGKPSQVKRNAKGETLLHVAAIKGNYQKVDELLKNGASTNVRENAGWTPLHEAVNHGYIRIAELLLNHGSMINTPGLDNDTPLHDAINNNRLDCVRLLVSRGASLSLRNIHGLTPVDIAGTDEMKEALKTPVNSQITDYNIELCEDNDYYQMLCFLGTALSRDEKIILQKCASVLQARVVEDFCAEVTHIITSVNKNGMCPRTLKYLRGILAGKWIVNMEWVATCQEYRSRVSEEGFEICGSSTNPNSQAPYKGRLNRKQQLPGFFDGCQFYFHGIFEYPTPEKEELVDLVKAGGGKLLTREPKLQNIDEYPTTVPYHTDANSSLKDCSLFIVHDTKLVYPPIKSTRICSIPALWILESIGSFLFQNIK